MPFHWFNVTHTLSYGLEQVPATGEKTAPIASTGLLNSLPAKGAAVSLALWPTLEEDVGLQKQVVQEDKKIGRDSPGKSMC